MAGSNALEPEMWDQNHYTALVRYAARRLHDRQMAADAVQESLLSAWRSRSRYRGHSTERTWLIGILRHKIADYNRRLSREDQRTEVIRAEDPKGELSGEAQWEDQLADRSTASPFEVMAGAELEREVERNLEDLPEIMSRAFSLREMQFRDSDQICRELAITPNNLSVLIHRARLKLRQQLAPDWAP